MLIKITRYTHCYHFAGKVITMCLYHKYVTPNLWHHNLCKMQPSKTTFSSALRFQLLLELLQLMMTEMGGGQQ